MSRARVTVVTSGHPSTCPRMVKVADAAADAGYDVTFVSVDYIDWAARFDDELVSRRTWKWKRVALRRTTHPLASRWVSARHRLARVGASIVGPSRTPLRLVAHAYARSHSELTAAILEEPFDFVYGGTVGALLATAEAARRARRPFALDFEDFHPAESEDADATLTHGLAARAVRAAAEGAAFHTAASTPIADAYAEQFGIRPLVVLNTVPRPTAPPGLTASAGPLKLYWFSQLIGPRRGLDDVVRAIAAASIPAELHLRGSARGSFLKELEAIARSERADVRISVHPPAAPDDMVRLCARFDVGLSLEQEGVLNRALCLPNKPLTYLAAGLAIIATDTPGQRSLSDITGDAVWWYRPGDIDGLARGLRRWHDDRAALARAREHSYAAALSRFHSEHPLERGVLVAALRRTLS